MDAEVESSQPNSGGHGRDLLRTALFETSDVRAVDTRRRLCLAYAQAAEDGAADITVVGLCRLAEVGRSTFYAHFATLEDLAVDMIGEIFRQAAPVDVARRNAHTTCRREITRTGVDELISQLWAVRPLVIHALGLPAGPVVRQQLVAQVVATTRGAVVAERPQWSAVEVDLATSFIGAGVVHLVLVWLVAPTIGREQLVDTLLGLLPSWLT